MDLIESQLTRRFETHPHGDLKRWLAALDKLPQIEPTHTHFNRSAVGFSVDNALADGPREQLTQALRELMPWRKGPFDFFGVAINTEWRSDWKWDRVSPHLSPLRAAPYWMSAAAQAITLAHAR